MRESQGDALILQNPTSYHSAHTLHSALSRAFTSACDLRCRQSPILCSEGKACRRAKRKRRRCNKRKGWKPCQIWQGWSEQKTEWTRATVGGSVNCWAADCKKGRGSTWMGGCDAAIAQFAAWNAEEGWGEGEKVKNTRSWSAVWLLVHREEQVSCIKSQKPTAWRGGGANSERSTRNCQAVSQMWGEKESMGNALA